jgi:hypothetical protein
MAYFDKFSNVVTFPQIVMEQIKKLQEIYSKELRDGDKILKNVLGEQVIEGEDTRYSFLQAVECLGILLAPYFIAARNNEELFTAYSSLLDKELVEFLTDENFSSRAKLVFNIPKNVSLIEKAKQDDKFMNQLNLFFLNYKLQEGRKIFRMLVQLFKDHDFLSVETFTDSQLVNDSMSYIDEGDEKLKFPDEERELEPESTDDDEFEENVGGIT